jgi:alanine dehydrogenase
MKIGIPREIKNHEYRVAITPSGAHELVRNGHQVVLEAGAGVGSAIPDEDFAAAGAKILPTADDVWAEGDMILKVKEPIAEEYHRMRSGQVLFTYRSRTRPSSWRTGRCRYSPRCRRSRAGWRRRSARTTCSVTAAAAGC